MTPAIIFLILTLVLKGLMNMYQGFTGTFTVISWILLVFIGASILMDIFKNIPKFMSTIPPESIKDTVADFKRRYLMIITLSIILRGVNVYLLIIWFIK